MVLAGNVAAAEARKARLRVALASLALAVAGAGEWARAQQIVAAVWEDYSVAVAVGGGYEGWGSDSYQRITGAPPGKTWAQLSAYSWHTCGVTTSGEGRCWGNDYDHRVSALPAGKTWAQLSAGMSHTCGVTTSGEPLCWGDNDRNQATVPTTLTVTRVDLSPAGFYRPGKDDIPCPAGWTSRPGAITVLGCSIEVRRCPLGQEGTRPNCTLCSPGTHRSLLSSPNCTSCAKGRYQDVAGGVNCTSCSPGTFADATGSTSASQCKSCSPGTFAAVDGSEKCAPCPEGSFENVNGRYVSYTFVFFCCVSKMFAPFVCIYSVHLFCLSFHLLNQIKLTLILTTHTHTYSTHMLSPTTPTQHNNSTQCKTCPTRTFADAKGLTRCKVCQAGTKYDGALLVTATANPCASCPAGTYRDNNRTETSADNECATCEVGKSSPASAASASSCTPCTAGKVGRLENGTCLLSREMLSPSNVIFTFIY